MGSKGSTPASQTTNQTQTYKADDRVKDAAHQSIRMGQAAVDQPFQTPTAPVAGLNDFQNQAFQGVQNIQGGWQPYVDAAKGYWDQSASSITGDDVNKYYNPMAQNVFAQLGDQQAQQWGNVTRGLTGAAGGQGASRIAVGQGVLANQQNLATGQVASNLWQQALQAAQQQKQFAAGAAGGMLQTGNAARQGATSDIGLLGQAGLQQQQQSQAELNAPYQNKLQEIAYPYQQAQYLAGLTSGVAPALGGSTAGQSTTTYQPAQPSALSQGIGLGMQGLGMMAGIPPGMGGGSKGSGGGNPTGWPTMGPVPFAEGGAIEPEGGPTQPGTYVPKSTVPNIQMQPGAGRSTMPSMVGAMKMEHAKQPKDAGASTSAGSVASQGLSAISSLTANQDEYAADTEADGGAVFPKHFYAAGGSTSDDWFSGGTEGVNTGPGMGIPGIDFAVDNVDMPTFKTPKPLDTGDWGDPTGGGASSAFPPPKTGIGTGGGASALALPPPPPPQNMEESFDKFSKASGAGWASRALGIGSQASPASKEPTMAGDESAGGLNMRNPFAPVSPESAGPPSFPAVAASSGPYPAHPRAGQNDDYSYADRSPPAGGIHPYGEAIARGESSGRWDAVGPVTKNGDQAYGKWQVMGANIPAWTAKYYGKRITDPQEFLHNREAQKAVFEGEFGRLQKAYGPLGAARAWFAGEGGMNDRSRKDVLGTTVDSYERKFAANANLGGGDNVEISSAGRDAPSISRESDNNRYDLPRTRQPYPDATDRDWGQQAARSPWNSLIRAGAVVASSPGPFGSALARGIAAGADQLQSERATRQKEVGVNQRAQQLHQQAQAHLDQYGRMTPFQKASLEAGKFTPFNYMGADGKPAVGAFNAKTGQLFDPTTGELISGATQLNKPGGAGGAGGSGGVFGFKMQAYLHANPGDEKGALDFANGRRTMGAAEMQKFAISQAETELKNSTVPITDPAERQKAKDQLAQRYFKMLSGASAVPGQQAAVAPAAEAAKPIPKEKIADAKKWLSEHPDDPRAAAIRESLKASGE